MEKQTIPELTYLVRSMARKSEAKDKDTLYSACFLLEHIDDFIKLVECIEDHNEIDEENPENTTVPSEVVGMFVDNLNFIREKFKLNDDS